MTLNNDLSLGLNSSLANDFILNVAASLQLFRPWHPHTLMSGADADIHPKEHMLHDYIHMTCYKLLIRFKYA